MKKFDIICFGNAAADFLAVFLHYPKPDERAMAKSVDTTGAGDVFRDVFAYEIFKKWPLRKTTQVAAIVAGLKCTRVGGRTGIPTLKEVSAFVQQRRPFSLSRL